MQAHVEHTGRWPLVVYYRIYTCMMLLFQNSDISTSGYWHCRSARPLRIQLAYYSFSLACVLLFASKYCCCLSFHPMAQCAVHALKGLACRARATPASSPASASSAQCSRRLRSTRVAVPVLLAHAEVKKLKIFFDGSKTYAPRGIVVAMPGARF